MTQPSFFLSPEELATFKQQGYIGPFTLYQPDEIRAIWRKERRKLFDRSMAIYKEDTNSAVTNIANYDRHLDMSFLADHICRPEIVHRVASILGPDVMCWRSEFFPKMPGDEGTDWHQADTFANASGKPQIVWPNAEDFGGTITVWSAFTEASIENGCLQFIPGTHEHMYYDESLEMPYQPDLINTVEKKDGRRGFFGYDYRHLQKDPDWEPEVDKAVSMVMEAGQFIIFWSTLMHASHPHLGNTDEMRLGFVGRYVPSHVKIYPDTEQLEEYGGSVSLADFGSVLVHGNKTYDYNAMRTETTRGKPFKKCC
ncbi:MAG: chlorinating enzyme [Acidobacteriota bacterium]|nr:chlorinating enzyme [Acidobacteriota bacterium]